MRKAVVGVIINKKDEILVGKKALTSSRIPGMWHVPGGHVNEGESLESAVKREMKEETNLDVNIINKIGELLIDNGTILVSWFLCGPLHYDLKSGDDLIDVKWVKKEEINEILHEKVKTSWPQEFLQFLNK